MTTMRDRAEANESILHEPAATQMGGGRVARWGEAETAHQAELMHGCAPARSCSCVNIHLQAHLRISGRVTCLLAKSYLS